MKVIGYILTGASGLGLWISGMMLVNWYFGSTGVILAFIIPPLGAALPLIAMLLSGVVYEFELWLYAAFAVGIACLWSDSQAKSQEKQVTQAISRQVSAYSQASTPQEKEAIAQTARTEDEAEVKMHELRDQAQKDADSRRHG